MPLQWAKMWIEALDDPKLTRLSLAERGAWWGILQLAGKCHADGKLVSGEQPLNMDEISEALHIKTSEDRQALESMIIKMKNRGSFRWNQGALVVVHWKERQSIPPSSTREAIAERVRLHRKRAKERKPMDPMLGERLSQRGIEYRKEQKKLGRDLTGKEREKLFDRIDRELEAKYGRKIEDALSGEG